MTDKLEYPLLPKWYYYAKYPDFKWYIVDSKRIVKSNAAEKGKDIGFLQPGDIVWLDFSEQALGWIRAGQVKPFVAPDFVYPEWRKVLDVIQPIAVEREAWIEFDLGHVKPYSEPVEPPIDPDPIDPPIPDPVDPEPTIVWQFTLFGYTVTITKE